MLSRPSAEGTLPKNGCKSFCKSALNFGLNGPGSLKTELHNKQEPPEVSSFFVLAEPEDSILQIQTVFLFESEQSFS